MYLKEVVCLQTSILWPICMIAYWGRLLVPHWILWPANLGHNTKYSTLTRHYAGSVAILLLCNVSRYGRFLFLLFGMMMTPDDFYVWRIWWLDNLCAARYIGKQTIWKKLCYLTVGLCVNKYMNYIYITYNIYNYTARWFGTCLIFPFSWECHNPNWQSIFRRGGSTTPSNEFEMSEMQQPSWPSWVYHLKTLR